MITTLQQHVVQQQSQLSDAPRDDLQWIFSGLALATKMIQAQVRRAALVNILGSVDEINVQGEVRQKLDVFANETLIDCFSLRESIGIIASEENEHPIAVRHTSPNAQYAIVFDPLDGSSNIDVAVTIGTTFSIFRRPDNGCDGDPLQWVLQPGRQQIAAGYVVYGSSTVLVYSIGSGVHGFTLDPSVGSYILTHENITMPEQGSYYSINEAYLENFPAVYRRFVERLKNGAAGQFYSTRFIGSMVADFHRTLLRGGIFLYPASNAYPDGRLRLLYEANPIAFLAEQAGGAATDGDSRNILDIVPVDLHQRASIVVGGKFEMAEFERCRAMMK